MTLAQIILAHNNRFAYVDGKLGNPKRGSVIHKIDAATAQSLAPIIEEAASETRLPLSYVLACLAIESAFDPLAQGGNFMGSNPGHNLDGYDLGICQFKLRYLIGKQVHTAQEAAVFCFTPALAVSEFCQRMVLKLAYASRVIAGFPPPGIESIHPLMHDEYLLGTGAYNFGESGILELIKNRAVPSHCLHVKHLEALFASQLGQPSVIGDIPEALTG